MTSPHEAISCDFCKKSNFKGLRYKCLVCNDYDLCGNCYEAGNINLSHNLNHPMQCMIAKNDYDLFYSGETISSDLPQSLVCPLCGMLGFTETTIIEHVASEHGNADTEESPAGIVCPLCIGETNQLIYDFATHLTMEHRSQREGIEPTSIRGRGARCHTRVTGPRGRRSQPHYNAVAGTSNSGAGCIGTGVGPIPSSVRESTDQLVEILAHFSGVRRTGGASSQSQASQLHQLQMHLQSSSFSPRSNHERNEIRIMRRTGQPISSSTPNAISSASNGGISSGGGAYSNPHYSNGQPFVLMDHSSLGPGMQILSATGSPANVTYANGGSAPQVPEVLSSDVQGLCSENSDQNSQSLLQKCMKPNPTEAEEQAKEVLKADRSLFVQELLLQIGVLEKAGHC